ncbi:MAG: branched-chain amino acid ABC transporter permease [Rhodospirillales bacterium]|nr:branched-chain amino acid ABC transporter permease [Rhodospirillales bacterium]
MRRRRSLVPAAPGRIGAGAVLVLLVALAPLVYTDQYYLGIVVTTLILITLNSSWNFLLGMVGVWNFGQLAVYAAGGYAAGLIMIHSGVPGGVALLGGGLAAALLSIALAFPTLRLFGIYTSLLTFSFAQVIQFVIINDNTGITGGPFGLPEVRGLFGSLSPLDSMRAYYWTALAVAVATLVLTALTIRSSLGLALRALRDSLPYGAARGVSPLRYRVIAFALSGFVAGVAGGLYTSFNTSIGPGVMGLTPMSIYVTMIVIGGMGTLTGPVWGTALVVAIQQALINHPGIQLTVLGAILLVIVVFVPRGLVGEVATLARRLRAWIAEGDGDEEAEEPELVADRPAEVRTVPIEPARSPEAR